MWILYEDEMSTREFKERGRVNAVELKHVRSENA